MKFLLEPETLEAHAPAFPDCFSASSHPALVSQVTAKNATRIQRLWRGLRTRLMFSDMLEYVRMMAEIRRAADRKKERLKAAEAPPPAVAETPQPSPKAAAPAVAKPGGHRSGSPSLPPKRSPKPAGPRSKRNPPARRA